jgi:hypothetical protein
MDLSWGFTSASFDTIYDLYEGFDNVPGLIGSDTRGKGKITGWKSGFKEGGIGLGYGLWDGIAGLFTEPIVGAKQNGAAGAMVGFGKGCESCMIPLRVPLADVAVVNAVARPTAGTLGLFTLPAQGMAVSMRSTFRRMPKTVYRAPREDISHSESANLSSVEKERLLATYHQLVLETKTRRKTYREKRHRVFLTGEMVTRPSERLAAKYNAQTPEYEARDRHEARGVALDVDNEESKSNQKSL